MTRLVLIGLVAGVFSSLFGVGGGILIVPALMLLAGFAAHDAAATSIGAIGITALAGTFLYGLHGDLRPGYAVLVGIPAVAGVLAGTAAQQRLSSSGLALGFAVLLAGIGVWLVVG